AAAKQMKQDGWWLSAADFPKREQRIRQHLIGDTMRSLFQIPAPIATFYQAVMRRKDDDHHASHNDAANQFLHLVSSSAFLISYMLPFSTLPAAMWLGVPPLLVRHFGHAVLEPACHDAEALLLGYNTPSKTTILLLYLAVPFAELFARGASDWQAFVETAPLIALHWYWFT